MIKTAIVVLACFALGYRDDVDLCQEIKRL